MPDQPGPDPTGNWWTSTDVARYLGVHLRTVSAYRGRQQMPAPDGRIGQSWFWAPERIIKWNEQERPRAVTRNLNSAKPDSTANAWTAAEVGAYLNIRPTTVIAYKYKKIIPEPVGQVNGEPVWDPQKIITWDRHRKKRNAPKTQ